MRSKEVSLERSKGSRNNSKTQLWPKRLVLAFTETATTKYKSFEAGARVYGEHDTSFNVINGRGIKVHEYDFIFIG